MLIIDLFNGLSRCDSVTSTLFELVDMQLFPVILNLMSMLFFFLLTGLPVSLQMEIHTSTVTVILNFSLSVVLLEVPGNQQLSSVSVEQFQCNNYHESSILYISQ